MELEKLVQAKTMEQLVDSMPKINQLIVGTDYKVVSWVVSAVDQSFLDWLFRRPQIWSVKMVLEKQESHD